MGKRTHPTTTPDWGAVVKRRTRFYTLIAAILAVLFGVLLYSSLSRQNLWTSGDLISMVFAAEDIPSGIAITEDMLTEKKIPEQLASSSGFLYQEQIIGREAIFPLIAGEMILTGKLVGDQGGPTSGRCPRAKWCVSLPTRWLIAAPPSLAVGDRIEIASVLPGENPEHAGFVVTGGQIVYQTNLIDQASYVIAVDDREALSLLYAAANQFQLLVLVRPSRGQ